MKKLLSITYILAICINAFSQRTVRSINDAWAFTKENVTETVNIPHTWNAHDTWDETEGFYRGICSYRKTVRINDNLNGKKVYVRFEGAYQECELKVNGKSVGKHIGGYSAFIFDVTSAIRQGDNRFEITVDSRHNADIPPLSADFTFYGGVYRDVDLVITERNHICNTHYASNGVYLTTPKVDETSIVNAKTMLDVETGTYTLTHTIFSPSNEVSAISTKKVKIRKDTDRTVLMSLQVRNTELWDIDSPKLYRVETILADASGKILDKVTNPLGFRTWSFDAEKGFTLNGRHIKILGTNRHQDFLDMGNALPDNMHERDIQLMKDMGGNFLRISHYPQDPIVCQLCDRYGIVNSIEIPIVNAVTESDAFRHNCVEMAREMVCQNYNNPSVIIWAYMNEVLLKVPNEKKQGEALTAYYSHLRGTAQAIEDTIKELDPYRTTMLPCDGTPNRYKDSGAGEVPDILGFNFYKGWYGKNFEDFDKEIKICHEMFPNKPLIITEYGAGVDPRLHSEKPTRFDFTNEYGVMFHNYYLDAIKRMDFLSGANVWNLNDFYAENRVDAVPHVNNKGLVGLDRKPKDVYLFYQANMLDQPFLRIGGQNWKFRGGNEGDAFKVSVFTNQKGISLFCNGDAVSEAPADPENGIISFMIKPIDGENTIKAKSASGLVDVIHFNYAAVPSDMKKFTSLNVSLGGDCQFEDDIQGLAWIPEQEYKTGSWGYTGGTRYGRKNWNGHLNGTPSDILGTLNNPIFQTQRVGLESFKADVPDGQYYIYLYFAELAVNTTGEPLPYNLGNDPLPIKEEDRVFSVRICGDTVLSDYNIKEEVGGCRAAIEKFTVDVSGGKGISIDFIPVKGKPILNAIRIYRCF